MGSPPVGWVVVTDGSMVGRDFTIRPGENEVGRAPDSAIALTWDFSVAERGHAVLLYDSPSNRFALRPGVNAGSSAIDGQRAGSTVSLRPGARLRFGATNLVFIPLAGDQFRWS